MASDDVLAQVDAALAEHFGQVPVRASVSFVGVEQLEVLRFEPIPGERAYLTLGMSRHPMTSANASMRATDGPRAELMVHLVDATDRFSDVWRQLAVLAAAPVVEGVVYAPGMTVDLGQPLAPGATCTGAVIQSASIEAILTTAGPVEILLLSPATANELAWARVRGSAELIRRWGEQDVDLLDPARRGADLA